MPILTIFSRPSFRFVCENILPKYCIYALRSSRTQRLWTSFYFVFFLYSTSQKIKNQTPPLLLWAVSFFAVRQTDFYLPLSSYSHPLYHNSRLFPICRCLWFISRTSPKLSWSLIYFSSFPNRSLTYFSSFLSFVFFFLSFISFRLVSKLFLTNTIWKQDERLLWPR